MLAGLLCGSCQGWLRRSFLELVAQEKSPANLLITAAAANFSKQLNECDENVRRRSKMKTFELNLECIHFENYHNNQNQKTSQ